MFCDINFKRKNNTIEILDKRGEISSLYSKLVEYVQQNGVPQESMWYFDNLKEQGKITSDDPYELALGLYSIAFHSDKSENYWINKIQDLIPKSINNISYQLKSVDILLSDKAKQMFEKGKKNNWSLDKILSELAISKEQKTLIEGIQKDMSYYEDIPFNEQLAIELTNRYSYVIKINTAKFKESVFAEKDEDGYYTNGDFVERKEGENTNYYSNLTVPGGTNYTEQEIATPAITPSIKGHAQFSTDNGIGWFRSDEQVTNGIINKIRVQSEEPTIAFDDEGNPYQTDRIEIRTLGGNLTKTRRILEVQSDLFQKGRGKEDLTTIINSKIEDWKYKAKTSGINTENGKIGYNEDSDRWYIVTDRSGTKNITLDEAIDLSNGRISKNENIKGNQFLQLLNKDNNWVTFFIKSIIQDSVKKGYEKVLFPTGNTASKVEGHSTLEEFKREKEDRIELLGIEKNNLETYGYAKLQYRSLDGTSDGEQVKNRIDQIDTEINQLKQELERVEKEGFGALRPIYNFYENTVTNILKKQGLNPVLITDEYGNTWNEVVLNNNFNPILLDKQADRYTPSLLMYQDFIKKNQLYTGEEVLPFIGESEYYRYLVPMLLKMNPEVRAVFDSDVQYAAVDLMIAENLDMRKIDFISEHITDTANGAAIIPINTAIIKSDTTTKTVVHELIHLTLQKEYNKKGEFFDSINALYNIADKYASDNLLEDYGFYSSVEFLAEALSNPEFMQKLNEIPYKEETIFSYLMRLVSDFINELLGVELNSGSVLAEVINLSEQVLQKNVSEISKNTPVELSSMGQEIITNFESYFPDYGWMNDAQKHQTAKLVEQGKLTLNCKF